MWAEVLEADGKQATVPERTDVKMLDFVIFAVTVVVVLIIAVVYLYPVCKSLLWLTKWRAKRRFCQNYSHFSTNSSFHSLFEIAPSS